jgi:hypothetical protein
MLNNSMRFTSIVFLIILLASCRGNKNKAVGVSYINYPNMEEVIKENLDPYIAQNFNYKKTDYTSGKKDTSFVKNADIPWADIKKLLLENNLYSKKLDKKYTIDVAVDTLAFTKTMIYTATDKSLAIKTMSITHDEMLNKMSSIYFESYSNGFFSSSEIKVLYVVGKLIQLQEKAKKAFKKEKKSIVQYDFIN